MVTDDELEFAKYAMLNDEYETMSNSNEGDDDYEAAKYRLEEYYRLNNINQTIINKTPHSINFYYGDKIYTFKSDESPCRITSTEEDGSCIKCGHWQDFIELPIKKIKYGKTENLPEQNNWAYYIVSSIVKANNPDRKDLIVPNDFVRDDKGNIIGCKSFIM